MMEVCISIKNKNCLQNIVKNTPILNNNMDKISKYIDFDKCEIDLSMVSIKLDYDFDYEDIIETCKNSDIKYNYSYTDEDGDWNLTTNTGHIGYDWSSKFTCSGEYSKFKELFDFFEEMENKDIYDINDPNEDSLKKYIEYYDKNEEVKKYFLNKLEENNKLELLYKEYLKIYENLIETNFENCDVYISHWGGE